MDDQVYNKTFCRGVFAENAELRREIAELRTQAQINSIEEQNVINSRLRDCNESSVTPELIELDKMEVEDQYISHIGKASKIDHNCGLI